IFVGPNDLAASMRSKEGRPPSAEATAEAMRHILATCRKHKVAPGLHCLSGEEARHRIEEGWQFVAIGSELKMMLNGTAAELQRRGGSQKSKRAKSNRRAPPPHPPPERGGGSNPKQRAAGRPAGTGCQLRKGGSRSKPPPSAVFAGRPSQSSSTAA